MNCIVYMEFSIFIFFYFLREKACTCVQAVGGRRGRERTLGRLHAQQRAQSRAGSHYPMTVTRAKVESQMLKQGTLGVQFLGLYVK